MIIGAAYLTERVEGAHGEGRVFRHLHELERAYEAGDVALHAEIEFRSPKLIATPANGQAATYHKTTVGRVFFDTALPAGSLHQRARQQAPDG
jgi:DNA-directed RNA polymerase subunit beta'